MEAAAPFSPRNCWTRSSFLDLSSGPLLTSITTLHRHLARRERRGGGNEVRIQLAVGGMEDGLSSVVQMDPPQRLNAAGYPPHSPSLRRAFSSSICPRIRRTNVQSPPARSKSRHQPSSVLRAQPHGGLRWRFVRCTPGLKGCRELTK